jgi:hypothetical protein
MRLRMAHLYVDLRTLPLRREGGLVEEGDSEDQKVAIE